MNDQMPEDDNEDDELVLKALKILNQTLTELSGQADKDSAVDQLRRDLLDQQPILRREWFRTSLLRILNGRVEEIDELFDHLKKSGEFSDEEIIRMRGVLIRYVRHAPYHP